MPRTLRIYLPAVWLMGCLVLAGSTLSAAPPILNNAIVSPTVLDINDPLPTVTIAVNVDDPDNDLNPAKVKVIVKYTDGKKERIVLQDDGKGRFTGEVLLNTDTTQDVLIKLKAKDVEGEKATPILQTISIHDCGNALGNGNEIIDGPSGPDGPDHDSVFRSLAIHPLNPDIILMGTERNGFVKSENGGTSWRRLRTGLRHTSGATDDVYPEIWDIAFDPTNPSQIYAATLDSPGPVIGNFPSTHAGVYLSTDEGETWHRRNCGLSNSRVSSVQVDPSNPNTVIIGVEGGAASFTSLMGQEFDGGIYRSTDGGAHWSRRILANADDSRNGYWHIRSISNQPHALVTFGLLSFQTDDPDNAGNVGFIRSIDAGRSWQQFGDPVKDLLITHFDVSSDGKVIYANERDSFEIQTSRDSGNTWTTTFHNQVNGPVAVSPNDPDRVLYAGTSLLTLSTDGLETTQVVLEAAASIHDIVFAPSDPNIVYVATEGYLIYRSADAGESFSFIDNIRANVLNR